MTTEPEEVPPRLRLFVAIDLPAEVVAAVDQATDPLRVAEPLARWTTSADWHVTLAFLGGTAADLLPPVEAAIAEVAREVGPFSIRLTGTAGTFGDRVLWAGLSQPPLLNHLVAGVRDRLDVLGFAADEEPFVPHVTLARAPRRLQLDPGLAHRYRGPGSVWTVREVALVRSRLGIGGTRYSDVRRWSLGGRAAR